MTNNLLTDNLSAPLNGATTAKVDIKSGSGNLIIDQLVDHELMLASGTLEYFEKQGKPTLSVSSDNGEATLTLTGSLAGQPWFRLPWTACYGATQWWIHLNPNVSPDISARTGGGNVKLNLAGMAVTHLSADTGGGNVEIVLPDHVVNLSAVVRTGAGNVTVEVGSDVSGTNTIEANSGAGNVTVRVPDGLPARVYASSGLGKVVVEPQFSMIDRHTYQSPDYSEAVNKIDITLKNGAGSVIVTIKNQN